MKLALLGLLAAASTVVPCVACGHCARGRRPEQRRPPRLEKASQGALLDKHQTYGHHASVYRHSARDTPAASFVDSEEVVNGDEADAFDDMGLAGDDAFEEDEAVHSGKAILGYDGHSHGNAHESSHGHSHSHSTSQSHGYPHGHSHGSHSHHHHPHYRHHKPKETTNPSSYSSSAGKNGKQALYGQKATDDAFDDGAAADATVASDGFIPSRGQRLQRRRGGSHGHFHSIARHSTEHKTQDGVAHLPANLTAVGQNGKRASSLTLVDSDEVIYEEALDEQDLGDDAVDDDAIVEPSTMGTETLAGASLHHDGRRHHWHRTTGQPGKKSFAQVINLIGAKIASSQVGPSAFADAEASMDGHSNELIGGGGLESNDFADSEFGDDGLDEEEETADQLDEDSFDTDEVDEDELDEDEVEDLEE
ncbi:hypothetical protein DFJ73DRAFT_902787 [Zopfochytrium polystomum]|nr:hypothetical protein DFJ73DRAFT_902787 [Zopfochytrium polystomum]